MKVFFTTIFLTLTLFAYSQAIADFENFSIGQDSFLNGSQGNTEFVSGEIILNSNYNAEWASWSGWAISSRQDTETPDYTNDLSSITGAGYESDTYAVNFGNATMHIMEAEDVIVESMYVNNSTYAYNVIKDGNQFSKKFGGEDGTDPDYFLLNIVGYNDGEAQDTVKFYLADYRADDSSEDYIISEWTKVDLESLGEVDSLGLSYESTDVGQFGINTPLYVCIDDVKTSRLSSVEDAYANVGVYPNPVKERLFISGADYDYCKIYTLNGEEVFRIAKTGDSINLPDLQNGMYYIQIIKENTVIATERFVKL